MIALIHSSKTMRAASRDTAARATEPRAASSPQLLAEAEQLVLGLQKLTAPQLARTMHLSQALAGKTRQLIANWQPQLQAQEALPALDSFIGDIYSGLRGHEFSPADRKYAQEHLWILSGLYGVLRPLDAVQPYRLEMGYKIPIGPHKDLYDFWGSKIAQALPPDQLIFNLASAEYSRAVLPFVAASVRVISPRFLTLDPATKQPEFRAVHAKIARGAFARWLMLERKTGPATLPEFTDLGYEFVPKLSTPDEPTFVCGSFGGKGLSMRLQPAKTIS